MRPAHLVVRYRRRHPSRPVVRQTAARLQLTSAQVALRWLFQLAPNVLLIPGTGSLAHLRENLAAEDVTLDSQAVRDLDSVSH
jgi:pyridoxine 4-dehydrogenase